MKEMLIDWPEQLTPDTFAERDIYDEILSIEDELDRSITANKIRQVAKNLGQTKVFDTNYKMAQREYARIQKRELANTAETFGACITDFSTRDQEQGQFQCGDWIADNYGVRLHSEKGLAWACPHPIYISKILRNVETGKYKAEIEYKLPNRPKRTFCVDRKTLASASKILEIADDGVVVTSLTAPLLVKYLADLQILNPDMIVEKPSTSRLGWIDGFDSDGNPLKQFLPYQSEIEFDNSEMSYLFNSIQPHGDRDKWYKLVKEIRAKKQPEVLINLAASFASVLVAPCQALPFIVSLWGGTGIGKTVILKLCTSIWANPKEGQYIASSKSTYVGTEIQLNILNSLPLMIDDMAQLTINSEESLQEIIYNCCAGQGKNRGNKDMSMRKHLHWKNCTITNGERSLVDESMQGGAINRVIDIEASGEALFDGKLGNKTISTIEANFGHAGEEFIMYITDLGFEEIKKIYNEQYERVREAAAKKGVEKEDKQIAPMALILTGDYLSEKYLFMDGIRIDVDQVVDYLRSKGEISEVKTAYENLMDEININAFHFSEAQETFNKEEVKATWWGCYLNDNTRYIAIVPKQFRAMIGSGSLAKAFLSWAYKKGILATDSDKKSVKTIRIDNVPRKMVVIDTQYDVNEENPENTALSGDDYEELPFK